MQPIIGVLGIGGGELILLLFLLVGFGCVLAVGLGVAVYVVVRSGKTETKTPPMVATRQPPAPPPPPVVPVAPIVESPTRPGSRFHRVSLVGADFEDVNLTSARFHNANLSNITVTAAQMGGAVFKHVGPPPDPTGKQERQRPVRFEEMMLCESIFMKVDLSNVRLTDCLLTGMTIDGYLVTDLIAAYSHQQQARQDPSR
jgi:hypothetical protein